MTPERRALILANMPAPETFVANGYKAYITEPSRGDVLLYQFVMKLDGFTDMNKRLSPTLPAPEPLRSWEIVCEGEVFASGTY